MEMDDSQVRSTCASPDSYDAEPAAVRRRLDLEGSFASADHHRADNLASDHRTKERTCTVLSAEGNEDGSEGDESLLEVTLTSQQGSDTGPSVVDTSRDGSCMNVSYSSLVETDVRREVKVSQGDMFGQKVAEFDTCGSSAESTLITPSGYGTKDEMLPSSTRNVSAGEQVTSPIHQPEVNTVREQCKFQWESRHSRSSNSEHGGRASSETDLSCADSASDESSSGFYGDIDDTEYKGSLASSVDLVEAYDNLTEALEMEKLREEDSVNVVGSCLEKISSKIGHLHEVAAKVLSNYRAPDVEAIISEMGRGANTNQVAATGVPSIHRTTDDEAGNSTLKESTRSDENDIPSEDADSGEQRFVAVKAYVLVVYSNYGRENEDSGKVEERRGATGREAVTASRASSEDDRASTKAQYGTSEDTASLRSQFDSEWTTGSDKDSYAKKLRNTCKSARTSRRIVTRQHGIMSKISIIAEQRVRKMNVTCLTILNCVKGTANVVSAALEAKCVARMCLQQATARAGNAVFEVADAATSASRFSREAVAFAEWAVQLHEEAAEATKEAEMSLDAIHFEEARGRDLSQQVSAYGDEIVKLIQQTSNLSLEELSDKKCVVESSSGTMSFALKEVKQESTSIENLGHRCDRVLSDVSRALERATSSSLKAINAALKTLETFRSQR